MCGVFSVFRQNPTYVPYLTCSTSVSKFCEISKICGRGVYIIERRFPEAKKGMKQYRETHIETYIKQRIITADEIYTHTCISMCVYSVVRACVCACAGSSTGCQGNTLGSRSKVRRVHGAADPHTK